MSVVQVVAEGMFQVRMRGRLQIAVELEMPLTTMANQPLVQLVATRPVEATMASTAAVASVAERKRGVLVAWPSQVSATLRRMKAAISPAGNTQVLKLFEAPSPNRP